MAETVTHGAIPDADGAGGVCGWWTDCRSSGVSCLEARCTGRDGAETLFVGVEEMCWHVGPGAIGREELAPVFDCFIHDS